MTREHRALLIGLAILAVAVPLLLGLTQDWAPTVWLLLIVVLLGGVSWLGVRLNAQDDPRQNGYRSFDSRTPVESPIPFASVPTEKSSPLPEVSLSSVVPDYRFLFSATVYWRPTGQEGAVAHGHPESQAVNAVLARASNQLANEQPNDHAAARYRLADTLGAKLPDFSGRYLVWADNISLTIPDDDATRLQKLAELRKHEQVWDHERRFEMNMRTYLTDDVLTSTGSAVVWWLSRNPNQIEETVRLISTLARLSAAANNTEVDQLYQDAGIAEARQMSVPLVGAVHHTGNGTSAIRALATEAFTDGDDPKRVLFGHDIAKIAERYGKHDLANQAREVFRARTFTVEAQQQSPPPTVGESQNNGASQHNDPDPTPGSSPTTSPKSPKPYPSATTSTTASPRPTATSPPNSNNDSSAP
ncbi:hypothetical protein [Allokutzneria albata]|uniref:Uncharacterized protein n=1 Tax=Allokutzneria albata TaxID=211114 RepID=A0A1G9Y5K1_ALLAB|nr:hypothetical protein [Allokutzneria albata]SDN04328.1 hypothetical protein SAMN04489726_4614 [Allokutzneria albata]